MTMSSFIIFTAFIIVNGNGISKVRTNILIISDVNLENKDLTTRIIEEALQQISLADYHVSFHTTSGTSHGLYEFQTRKCLLKKIKQAKPTKQDSLLSVLGKSIKDLGKFSYEKSIVLIITDKNYTLSNAKLKMLLKNIFRTFWINLNRFAEEVESTQKDNILEIRGRSVTKILAILPFLKADLKNCQDAAQSAATQKVYVFDECQRQCECVNGKMINCNRVRKEFSSMNLNDRRKYIRSLKELSTNPKYKDIFDNYSNIHEVHFFKGLHESDQFLPWHRKYILGYENLLRLIDCSITVPVWNWAYFSEIAWMQASDYHMWDEDGGFGGNGIASKGFCVDNGEFQVGKWQPLRYSSDISIRTCRIDEVIDQKCLNITEVSTFKTCLRRRFHGNLPNYTSILKIKDDVKNLLSFELVVRSYWHSLLHNIIGGHMETTYASFSPEFWSHHAMLDAIWYFWQQKEKERILQKFPGTNNTLIAFQPIEIRDNYIDSKKLGGCKIQVAYDEKSILPKNIRVLKN